MGNIYFPHFPMDQDYIKSGFISLDKIIGGFRCGELISISGDANIGTTYFALSIIQNVALNSKRNVAFLSLDMTYTAICNRLLSSQTGIEYNRITTDKISQFEWLQIQESIKILKNAPIFIDTTGQYALESLILECARLKKEENIELFIIDKLEYIKAFSTSQTMSYKWMAQNEETEYIIIELKKLAKELATPFIVLSQLNWKISFDKKSRFGARPTLDTVGTMANHADLALILYRPEYYGNFVDIEENSIIDKDEIIIVKNRNGQEKMVPVKFTGKFVKVIESDEIDFSPEFNIPSGGLTHAPPDKIKTNLEKFENNTSDDLPF